MYICRYVSPKNSASDSIMPLTQREYVIPSLMDFLSTQYILSCSVLFSPAEVARCIIGIKYIKQMS